MQKMANPKELHIVINTGTKVGSDYAQIANVTVTDVDMTLEFAFIHPRDKTKGQVVARITLPFAVGVDLARAIMDTVQLHEKKKKGGPSD